MEKITISKEDVDEACKPTDWYLGNKVLYDFCRGNPGHTSNGAIIAKIWLIGRAYSAAIERRKNATNDSSEKFYENKVAPMMMSSSVDAWIESLQDQTITQGNLERVVNIHKQLTDLFYRITELKKRSLASKYLHFHKPDLFFIYDSRAREAINAIKLSGDKIGSSKSSDDRDGEYYTFCCRALQLRDDIERKFERRLSPRQLDNLFLQVFEQIKKKPTVAQE